MLHQQLALVRSQRHSVLGCNKSHLHLHVGRVPTTNHTWYFLRLFSLVLFTTCTPDVTLMPSLITLNAPIPHHDEGKPVEYLVPAMPYSSVPCKSVSAFAQLVCFQCSVVEERNVPSDCTVTLYRNTLCSQCVENCALRLPCHTVSVHTLLPLVFFLRTVPSDCTVTLYRYTLCSQRVENRTLRLPCHTVPVHTLLLLVFFLRTVPSDCTVTLYRYILCSYWYFVENRTLRLHCHTVPVHTLLLLVFCREPHPRTAMSHCTGTYSASIGILSRTVPSDCTVTLYRYIL